MAETAKRIVNARTGTTVVSVLREATNPWARFIGLMGKPEMPVEYDGLWIEPCKDIHSFFLRFEFDAVFLDKEGAVVHLIERMKPWRVAAPIWAARVVLELDGGKITEHDIQIGDVLSVSS